MNNNPYYGLAYILKTWIIYSVAWALYVYIFGDIRFLKIYPINHWITGFVKPFDCLGILFIGKILRLLLVWGIPIPFVLSYLSTLALYSRLSKLYFLVYILALMLAVYATSIFTEYRLLVVNSRMQNIFNNWSNDRLLYFLIRFDVMYIYIFISGSAIAILTMFIKTWRRNNG